MHGEVERLSLWVTVRLGLEVTLAVLLVAGLPVYVAFRGGRRSGSGVTLLLAAGLGLLVPTIARSLAFSALFSYYGPLASVARAIGVWPKDQPLESSHAAVLIALVTLYLPYGVFILAQGVMDLGRAPEIAATLGASPLKRTWRVVFPGLSRPLIAASLVVFSQVLGVIVTPRILGSKDVTLAVLIDDFLKRDLNTAAALRLAGAELLLAVPIALVAASFFDVHGLRRLVGSRRHGRSFTTFALASAPALVILLPQLTLVALSLVREPVLSLSAFASQGPSLHWFREVIGDPGWRAIVGPSLLVWGTASGLAIGGALLTSLAVGRRPAARAVARTTALTVLFIPQNALGVVLFVALGELPQSLTAHVPGWALGGFGQAIPGVALAFLLIDGVMQRVRGSARVAESLGASRPKAFRRVVLPQLFPTLAGCAVATALISLDDIIFVRYLPRIGVNTFATELFARARFTASPDMAAACVLLWACVLGLLGVGALFRRGWRPGLRTLRAHLAVAGGRHQ